MDYIYFDQAASSFPKPKKVGEAISEAVMEYGANPGRSGHKLATKAGQVIMNARIKLAAMFAEKNPNNVCFFSNATTALNQAILGLPLKKGDHVISTAYEHNSVRRPLEFLKKTKQIEVTYIQPDANGYIQLEAIKENVRVNTKSIVVSHGSNVTGAIAPIEEIGAWSKKQGLVFVVDASQTAGVLPINMKEMAIDLLAFPGHKGLLGPQGTGVLIISDEITLAPIIFGGTGGFSELVEQPDQRPEKYESGTLNTPGIAGLLAGVEEVERIGLEAIFAHEWQLTTYCVQKLTAIDGVQLFIPKGNEKQLAVISFSMKGLDSHEAATILDEHYNIAVRSGLHCAPMTHDTLGTSRQGGLIRVSFGPYNTLAEVDRLIDAVNEIIAYF